MAVAGGGEIVYVGIFGSRVGGATLPGHVLSATMNADGAWSAWQDLTLNPVINDYHAVNSFGIDISSLFIDPHDATGNTVYVTIEGIADPNRTSAWYTGRATAGRTGHIYSTLSPSAANSPRGRSAGCEYRLPCDRFRGLLHPQRDLVCEPNACWSRFGAGLPQAPVVALSAAPGTNSPNVLVAGTFGRGVWQIPLAAAGVQLTTATLSPDSLDFGKQMTRNHQQPPDSHPDKHRQHGPSAIGRHRDGGFQRDRQLRKHLAECRGKLRSSR